VRWEAVIAPEILVWRWDPTDAEWSNFDRGVARRETGRRPWLMVSE